jgi:hypothetical protein
VRRDPAYGCIRARALTRFELTKPGVAAVGPGAHHVAADTKTEHEHRDDDGRRIDRVAENVAEDTYPDDLIDQAADAGEEKEEINQRAQGSGLRAQDSGLRIQGYRQA